MSTVRRYISNGQIPASQPGGFRARQLIPAAALLMPSAEFKVEKAAPSNGEMPGLDPKYETNAGQPSRLPGPVPRWKKQKHKREN